MYISKWWWSKSHKPWTALALPPDFLQRHRKPPWIRRFWPARRYLSQWLRGILFSPLTAFTYTIYKGNVNLVSPYGEIIRKAYQDDRVFLVASAEDFAGACMLSFFSDYALTSWAPTPTISTDLSMLEHHVHWDVFDEDPRTAQIKEIGYQGACKCFQNSTKKRHNNRSKMRMAEFLVHQSVPLGKRLPISVKCWGWTLNLSFPEICMGHIRNPWSVPSLHCSVRVWLMVL